VKKLRDRGYPFAEDEEESDEISSDDRSSNTGYTHRSLYFVFEAIRELLIKNNLRDILIASGYYKKHWATYIDDSYIIHIGRKGFYRHFPK
jgi:hypothetical protein